MSLTSNLAKYVKKNKMPAAPAPAAHAEPDGDEGSIGEAARNASTVKKKKVKMANMPKKGGGKLDGSLV